MNQQTSMADNPSHETDYRVRRGEISAYGRALASAKQLRWLIVAAGVAMLVVVALPGVLQWPMTGVAGGMFLILNGIVVVGGLWAIYRYINQNFIEPDLAFRMWLQQVCDGELDARIDLPNEHRHYKELNFHTRNLASSLRRLSDDMDGLVESQTKRLNDQKRVLELLFKLTTDVSSETEDGRAFETVCEYLAEWFDSACVSCYRLEPNESVLRCVAVRQSHPSGEGAYSIDIRNSVHISVEDVPSQISTVDSDNQSQRWVPFYAGEELAGVMIIEIQHPEQSRRIETNRVLTTVSEQLSLLCGKQLVQAQTLQARLNRDRNELAAEIHDSLAQTLLAVRYQATLLGEKIKTQHLEELHNDMLKISGSIEEANEEIRGLIRENRYPLSEHRDGDSLQAAIEQFNQSNNMPVFFQSDDPQIRFTPREESVLRRIIGEALNNARKYAEASMIRVFLQRTDSGMRRVLIEDDGVGFEHPDTLEAASAPTNDTGKRIGLTIMRERAVSIGAKLIIDSEPGEGTRVAITMPPLIESRRATR